MILFALLPLIAVSAPYILGGLDYLLRLALPSAPDTEPVSSPYTPPFIGGQCPVPYRFAFKLSKQRDDLSSVRYANDLTSGYTSEAAAYNDSRCTTYGSIQSITYSVIDPFTGNIRIIARNSSGASITVNTSVSYGAFGAFQDFEILAIKTCDGTNDSCGNLPNPVQPSAVGDSGLATSPSPNPVNFIPLITGIAAATAASILAAKSSAIAALTSAKVAATNGNIANAIIGLATALEEILEILDELEKEEEEEKEEDTVLKYDFGKVEKDGFIKLYPDDNSDKVKLSYIDLQVVELPSYLGKYFGQKSPHYYRYKSLGYISYASPTFGILETRQVDFKRLSLYPPENAMGFFYHFGLNGNIKANITGFYTKKPVPPPVPPA